MRQEFSYSGQMPELVQSIGSASNPLFQICFDTIEVSSNNPGFDPLTQFKSNYVQVQKLDYATIVSAIISSRYNSSDVEAIVLNNMEATDTSSSLSENKRTEYLNEYNELQSWRAHAKEIAGGII